jgi:hypothetical protein
MIKTELVYKYLKQGWTRWGAPQQIDPNKFIDILISDIINIIETTKPPTKNTIIKNIRQHYYGE